MYVVEKALMEEQEVVINEKGEAWVSLHSNTPTKLDANNNWDPFVSVAAGSHHVLLISSSGDVYGYGDNSCGQLGMSGLERAEELLLVPFFERKASAIACGRDHSLVLTKDGQLWSFGSNKYGQLGLGNDEDQWTPIQISSVYGVTQVSCGYYHTMCVCEDGRLFSWGWNKYGQLGHGDTKNRNIPTPVLALDESKIINISAGGKHSLVLVELGLGVLYSFGDGKYGQLGYESKNQTNNTPTKINFFEQKVIQDFKCGGLISVVLVKKEEITYTHPMKSYLSFIFNREITNLDYFKKLPGELHRNIIKYLPSIELRRFGSTCKYFMFLCNEDVFWKSLVNEKCSWYEKDSQCRSPWKCIYKSLFNHSHVSKENKRTYLSSLIYGIKNYIYPTKINVLLLGLDNSGKTTLSFVLRGTPQILAPNLAYPNVPVQYKNLRIMSLESGGFATRRLWRTYYSIASGIIFMVDSRDRSRMSEARHELHCLVADLDLTNIPILILANKQDLPSMSVHEVAYALRLRHIRDRDWCIKWCSIIHRAGLYDGLDWLSNLLS